VRASKCLQRILGLDKDLSFLPFLFSAYLFYGSVPFLSSAGQLMDIRVDAATSYTERCSETLIQAHQVLLAHLMLDSRYAQPTDPIQPSTVEGH
jgi:hypothetical protein